ncbi:hypothetical protein N9X07_03080 [Flavobacteriaceae bacterium]|nr:hypothetical protein [Flavobacteriaceae bacterium]
MVRAHVGPQAKFKVYINVGLFLWTSSRLIQLAKEPIKIDRQLTDIRVHFNF